MTIILETSYRHGELTNLMAKLNWTTKVLSERTGLRLAVIEDFLALKRRPSNDESEAIFECFAHEGFCLDLLSSWPKDFVLPDSTTKHTDSSYADSEFLISHYPSKRLSKLGEHLAFEPVDRIDARLFLDEIKRILSADEIIIFRSLLEGLTDQEIATKYCFSDSFVQYHLVAIRKKAHKLARHLDVSEENLKKLMLLFVDHSYAIPDASGRSGKIWAERHLPKTRAAVTKYSDRIRIRFVTKPSELIKQELEKHGWRYNWWNYCWYHSLTDEALAFAEKFEFEEPPPSSATVQTLPFRQDELF